MKTLLIITAFIFGSPALVFAQTGLQKESIKVWGNCGMCKKKIEKAAKSAGAKTATWSEETNVLKVVYEPAKTSSTAIQQAIAKAGYDTQDFTADNTAYGKLPACCHYDRKGTDSSTTSQH